MKKAEIEEKAKGIYNAIIGDGDWEGSVPSVKAFYRKIARWHLTEVERIKKNG